MQIAIEKYKTQILGKISVKQKKNKFKHKHFAQYLKMALTTKTSKKHKTIEHYYMALLKFTPFRLNCFLKLIKTNFNYPFTLLKLKNKYYLLLFQNDLKNIITNQKEFLKHFQKYQINVCSKKESLEVFELLNELLKAREHPSYLETHHHLIIGIKKYAFKNYDINSLALIIKTAQLAHLNLNLSIRSINNKFQQKHQFELFSMSPFNNFQNDKLVKHSYFQVNDLIPKYKIHDKVKYLEQKLQKDTHQTNFYVPINMQKQLIKEIITPPSKLKYSEIFTTEKLS